jgi:Rod binding domain-containing protein
MSPKFAHKNLFETLVGDADTTVASEDAASQDGGSNNGDAHEQHIGAQVQNERWDKGDGLADILLQELNAMPQKEGDGPGETSGEDKQSFHTATSNQPKDKTPLLKKAELLRIEGMLQHLISSMGSITNPNNRQKADGLHVAMVWPRDG